MILYEKDERLKIRFLCGMKLILPAHGFNQMMSPAFLYIFYDYPYNEIVLRVVSTYFR